MTLFLMIVAGLVLGVAGTVLAYRPLLRRYRLEHQNMQQYAEQLQSEIGTLRDQMAAQSEQLTQAAVRQAQLTTQLEAKASEIARQKEEMQALQERQRVEFKNLATEILEEKSSQFKQINR